MSVADRTSQTSFPADALSLLQALLATPVVPYKSRPDRTDAGRHASQALGAEETQARPRSTLEAPAGSQASEGPGAGGAPALLQTLLATPLSSEHLPSRYLLKPAALHGVEPLRHLVLKDRLRKDWFDTLLSATEWILIIVALLALGTWAALGPAGNWLHRQYAPAAASAPAQPIAHIPTAVVRVDPTSGSVTAQTSQPRPTEDATLDQTLIASQPDYLAQRQSLTASRALALPAQPTHLLIPAIGVDAPVVEVFVVNGDWEVAHYAAGYLHNTGLPGNEGNVVLAGHAGFFGGVFAKLGGLAKNDDVYIDAAGWRYHYRVRESIVVSPTQTEVLYATDIPIITLISCTNWDLQRIVVIADLVGDKPL